MGESEKDPTSSVRKVRGEANKAKEGRHREEQVGKKEPVETGFFCLVTDKNALKNLRIFCVIPKSEVRGKRNVAFCILWL